MSLAGLAAIALVALGLAAPLMLAGSAYKEFEFSAVERRAGVTLGPLDQMIHVPGPPLSPKSECKKPQFALHHPVPSTSRSQWPQLAAVQYKKPTAVVRRGFPCVYKKPPAVVRKGFPRVCSTGIYI